MKFKLGYISLVLVVLLSLSGCKSIAQRYIENVDVRVRSIEIIPSDLLFGKLSMKVGLEVKNNNLFPVSVEKMTYDVRVGKTSVVSGKSVRLEKKKISKSKAQKMQVSLKVPLNKSTYKLIEQVVKKKKKMKLNGVVQFGSPVGSLKSKFSSTL